MPAPLVASEPTADAGGFLLRPGVVVDAAAGRLYLAVPPDGPAEGQAGRARESGAVTGGWNEGAGGVEAIEVSSGRVLWRSQAAIWPLAAGGERLLALVRPSAAGSELALASLATSDGRLVARGRHDLPSGARASIDDGLGRQFRATASPSSATEAPAEKGWRLDWTYREQEVRGAPFVERAGAAPAETSWAGRLEVVEIESEGANESDELRFVDVAESVPVGAEPSAIELRGDQRLDVPAPAGARQFLSIDGRHGIVVVRGEGSARGDGGGTASARRGLMERYRWQVYDRARQRLGSLESPVSYAPFAVLDGVLIHEVQPMRWRAGDSFEQSGARLRAVDLASGAELWSRPLRDRTYRGPFPP